MKANYTPSIDHIIRIYEGDYSNDKGDPGGPTRWGITYIDAAEFAHVTAASMYDRMRDYPIATAELVYSTKYEPQSRFDDLQSGVDFVVLDYEINSGIGRAPRVLQTILGLNVTGKMDDPTVHAANAADPIKLVDAICDERLAFLKRLSSWPTFGRGWAARVADNRVFARSLIAGKAPSISIAPQSGKKATHIDPKTTGTIGKSTAAGTGTAVAAHGMHWNIEGTVLAVAGIVVLGSVVYMLEHRRQVAAQNLVVLPTVPTKGAGL